MSYLTGTMTNPLSHMNVKDELREYVLTSHTQLPPKDEIMTRNHNKKTLIKCLCEVETNDRLKLIGDESIYHHEEADVKIISHLLDIVPKKSHVQVLADDTDIFVLL